MEVLYFFESIRNPVLNALMSILTYLGSEVAFLAFAMGVFWCYDKRRGYYIMTVGYIGVIINQFLKIMCMIPRPWVIDPNFTTVAGAKADAGGYSFPSGHTQNATGTYGGIFMFAKKLWVRIACIALIVIVPITRMYLGVHTPLDVGVSLLIGAALVLALYPVFELTKKHPDLMYWLLGGFFLLSIVFTLFSALYPFSPDIDPANLYELRKNACTLLGATGGVFLFYPIEKKYIKFDEKATAWGQIVKMLFGIGLVMAVKEGLKAVFKAITGEEQLWMRSVRYFVVVAVAMGIVPIFFKYFKNIGAKQTVE